MFFSTFFTFISSEYPPQLFATLAGFANVLAGLGTTLQNLGNPLLDIALRDFNGDFLPFLMMQLGLAVMVLLGCIIAWCRASRQSDSKSAGHQSPEALTEAQKSQSEL
eukprot:symbB.v1.2.000499.t1/scaffold11.1/size528188/48